MRQAAANGSQDGGAQANAALDRLREAQQKLEGNQGGRAERDVQEAQRQAQELASEQKDVASQVDGLAQAGAARQSRAQSLAQRKDAMDAKLGDLQQQLEKLGNETRRDDREASRKLDDAAGSIRDRQDTREDPLLEGHAERAALGIREGDGGRHRHEPAGAAEKDRRCGRVDGPGEEGGRDGARGREGARSRQRPRVDEPANEGPIAEFTGFAESARFERFAGFARFARVPRFAGFPRFGRVPKVRKVRKVHRARKVHRVRRVRKVHRARKVHRVRRARRARRVRRLRRVRAAARRMAAGMQAGCGSAMGTAA